MKIPALVAIDPDFWKGRRVLLTGHTGFKGAWLSLWLQQLGADLTGLARGPSTATGVYALADVGRQMREVHVDVRDASALSEAVREVRPEVIFHLAAQPLVRRSLQDPAATFLVNVMGTVNLLEAVRGAGTEVRSVVSVTSDKCYENSGGQRRFSESDMLGGADPYSSSKACAELAVSAYRRSFFTTQDSPSIATARAGNVIGGGDWGVDRLVADSVRAVESGVPLKVRNPDAVRPWQHVLNPLSGYLRLAEEMDGAEGAARAWNFGPSAEEERSVGWIVQRLADLWEGALSWELDQSANPPEAAHLTLDSSDARGELGWSPPWGLGEALDSVVQWHRAHLEGRDMRRESLAQIARFTGESDATE